VDKNSSAYTFGFATVVTVVAALLLGFAATSLKPLQDKNADVDKKSKTLLALGLYEEGMAAKAVQDFFSPEGNENRFVVKFAVNHSGEAIAEVGDNELKNLELEQQMKKFSAGEEDQRKYPIFAYYDSKEAFTAKKASKFVIPVYGYGLWSNCYGVLALDASGKIVENLVYYKHGETPGLGGEIEKQKFSDSFIGKKVHDASGAVALTTSKSPVGDTQVRAISGATFTMDGVNKMLKDYLTIYGAYFAKINQGGGK
jgi:Na+-transporting NADH:ubiquinone oxidoreductase subunit C